MPKRVVRRKKVGGNLMSKIAIYPELGGSLGSIGLGKRRRGRPRKRRMVGRGFGDFIGNVLGGVGGGVGSGVRNLFGNLFGGARKRRRGRPRRRMVGRGEEIVSDAMPKLGTVGKINKILKDTKVISKALNEFGINPFGIGTAASTLGYGRKKRRSRRRIGGYVPASYRHIMGAGGLGNLHL